MAGFAWASRLHPFSDPKRSMFSSPRRPPTQIACRICDSVFTSTQALIDHIETHLVDDTISLATLPPPRRPRTYGLTTTTHRRSSSSSSNPFQLDLSTRTRFTTAPTSPFLTRRTGFRNIPSNPRDIISPTLFNSHSTSTPQIAPPLPRSTGKQPLLSTQSLLGAKRFSTGELKPPFLFPKTRSSAGNSSFSIETIRQHKMAMEALNDVTKPYLQQLDKPISYRGKGNNGNKAARCDFQMLDLTLRL